MTTTLDPLSDAAQLAAHWAREMTMAKAANTPSKTEAWLESLGSTFVDVYLYLPKSQTLTVDWLDERHIANPETLTTTVSMSLSRLGGRYAVWKDGEEWVLLDARKMGAVHDSESIAISTKRYPSREAAEMVAMHRRG